MCSLPTRSSPSGQPVEDTEIEKYFDMSVVLMPVERALSGIGTTITSMETAGAPMAARAEFQQRP